MSKLETVKVVNGDLPNGFMLINKSDFDPDVHEEFEEAAQAPTVEKVEDIAQLKRAELIALLKAQGVEQPEGNVPALKEQLTVVMFPQQ